MITSSLPKLMFGVLVKRNFFFRTVNFVFNSLLFNYRRPSLGNCHIGFYALPGHGSWRSKLTQNLVKKECDL